MAAAHPTESWTRMPLDSTGHPGWDVFLSKYEFVRRPQVDSDMTAFQCVGAGSFGAIFEVRRLEDGEVCCVKIISVDRASPHEPLRDLKRILEREVFEPSRLSDAIDADDQAARREEDVSTQPYYGARHLLRIFDYAVVTRRPGKHEVLVVMERAPLAEAVPMPASPEVAFPDVGAVKELVRAGLCPSGMGVELKEYLPSFLEFPAAANYVLYQLLLALRFLHDHVGKAPYIHRDIKVENILVWRSENIEGSYYPIVKLVDFGLCRQAVHGEMTANVGSASTQAPELLSPASRTAYDATVDIFSAGSVYYTLITGAMPDAYSHPREGFPTRFLTGMVPWFADRYPDGIHESYNRAGKLLRAMTATAPRDRSTAAVILAEYRDFLLGHENDSGEDTARLSATVEPLESGSEAGSFWSYQQMGSSDVPSALLGREFSPFP